ncbi:DNA-formamidopyrimidine glycosylase family protein [Nocardioides zeae]|uniref:DNA-formamidopyrimidine glycosylase family protein n=1 Tax=Nocardioides imazamoxiresistens TaxID=3231893 RepID=A0ABU3Q202_9ACTN|nr:DNA-formamidopyrimidine glycosylase family protein [Nocardioides zeae]MDT9595369.1 DNA-formamidopyrimidine glycosylase family protein [Nocardioides zeae]
MPELPEVETARAVVERAALGRTIAEVDDTDTWECRPHAPGEIRDALLGRTLTGAHRRGKSMWCTTSGDAGETGDSGGAEGPVLGLHLGMSGRILVTGPDDTDEDEGGDYAGRGGRRRDEKWFRFTLRFADGGSLRLLDPRRLGRVRLDPDLSGVGPDAGEVGREEFRHRVGRGTAPLKARLLDQSVVAGIGNLLVDETLWQARISPQRPAGELDDDDLDHLRRTLRAAIRSAIAKGGVHTGEVIAHRRAGEHCPRCGEAMVRGEVGGRTTWWCPREQR